MTAQGNRRVIITGASRGIGRATAVAFARTGARLALFSRSLVGLQATAAACTDASDVIVSVGDVRDENAIADTLCQVESEWGGVDAAVNNAGAGCYAPFTDLSAEVWEETLTVNVLGSANLIRRVLPGMIRQGHGHIVNVGSIRGSEAIPGTTAYAASKFALVGLTRALELELEGTGVFVSTVSPGGVLTGFGGHDPKDKDPNYLEPESIADTIVNVVESAPKAWIRDVTIMPPPLHHEPRHENS